MPTAKTVRSIRDQELTFWPESVFERWIIHLSLVLSCAYIDLDFLNFFSIFLNF